MFQDHEILLRLLHRIQDARFLTEDVRTLHNEYRQTCNKSSSGSTHASEASKEVRPEGLSLIILGLGFGVVSGFGKMKTLIVIPPLWIANVHHGF